MQYGSGEISSQHHVVYAFIKDWEEIKKSLMLAVRVHSDF